MDDSTHGLDDKDVEHAVKKVKLNKSTIAMIERKRQNAILLRESRLQCRPTTTNIQPIYVSTSSSCEQSKNNAGISLKKEDSDLTDLLSTVNCRECNICCNASYLHEKFGESVCDECRDKDKDQFKLISKTDAKNEFVLKDCDFDSREPPLKFVTAPNPHNRKGGFMKLYLQGQVYERACEVHGGDEGIDKAILQRSKNREAFVQRKMVKKLSELRNSSKPRQIKETHVHEFGAEIYHKDDDEYSHCCKSCGYTEHYEKL
ncbi:hypothetical protein ACHWQZ_G008696 [Mnemiopsis leidyi]